MARISESELEGYDVDFLRKMCKEVCENLNVDIMEKEILIRVIMWKENMTCKFPVGGYKEWLEKEKNNKKEEKSNNMSPSSPSSFIKNDDWSVDTNDLEDWGDNWVNINNN